MNEQFKIDNLIYSDVEFISVKYEDITGEAPSSQLTRTEGMKAGLSIPVLSAGVHTQETRNYQLSSFGMLKKIYETLAKYPSFKRGRCSFDSEIALQKEQNRVKEKECLGKPV